MRSSAPPKAGCRCSVARATGPAADCVTTGVVEKRQQGSRSRCIDDPSVPRSCSESCRQAGTANLPTPGCISAAAGKPRLGKVSPQDIGEPGGRGHRPVARCRRSRVARYSRPSGNGDDTGTRGVSPTATHHVRRGTGHAVSADRGNIPGVGGAAGRGLGAVHPDRRHRLGRRCRTDPVKRNATSAARLRLDGIDSLETHYTPATAPEPTSPSPWPAPPPTSCCPASASPTSGATPTRRSPPATPIRLPGSSSPAAPTSTAAASPSSAADPHPAPRTRLVRHPGLRRRGCCCAPPSTTTSSAPDWPTPPITATCSRCCATSSPPTVTAAQTAQRGVWAGDATTTGAAVTTATSLTDDVVILPKLFRRLADYLQLGAGDLSLVGLPAFLAQARDRFFILSTGHSTTGLDAIVEVTADTVLLTRFPDRPRVRRKVTRANILFWPRWGATEPGASPHRGTFGSALGVTTRGRAHAGAHLPGGPQLGRRHRTRLVRCPAPGPGRRNRGPGVMRNGLVHRGRPAPLA